jgi:uncharacterized protein
VSWIALAGACSQHPTVNLDVDGNRVRAEVVANDEDRARGLMFRDHLAASSGMLFVYPNQAIRHFWMKDTRIPLSIAFADREGTIVWIADMQPFDTDSTSSMLPATYALEMNQGWFAEHDVQKGDKIADLPRDIDVR